VWFVLYQFIETVHVPQTFERDKHISFNQVHVTVHYQLYLERADYFLNTRNCFFNVSLCLNNVNFIFNATDTHRLVFIALVRILYECILHS